MSIYSPHHEHKGLAKKSCRNMLIGAIGSNEIGVLVAADYDVWKCTCGVINDWGVSCRRGHGEFRESGGDIRLWQCSTCRVYNAWNRVQCQNGCGRYVPPR